MDTLPIPGDTYHHFGYGKLESDALVRVQVCAYKCACSCVRAHVCQVLLCHRVLIIHQDTNERKQPWLRCDESRSGREKVVPIETARGVLPETSDYVRGMTCNRTLLL